MKIKTGFSISFLVFKGPYVHAYIQWLAEKLDFLAVNDIRWGYFERVSCTLKVLLYCFLSFVYIDMTWGFQMIYFSSSQLKGLQNCDLSKLEVEKDAKIDHPGCVGLCLITVKRSLKPQMSEFLRYVDAYQIISKPISLSICIALYKQFIRSVKSYYPFSK